MDSIKQKTEELKKIFTSETEFKARFFTALNKDFVIWNLASLADYPLISSLVIKPLLDADEKIKPNFEAIKDIITISECEEVSSFEEVKKAIEKGESVLCFEGSENYIKIPLISVPKRAIAEPQTSNVIRGPRAGFIEDYKTNISLIRQRLSTDKFRIIELEAGRLSRTKVAIVYLKGIASRRVVKHIYSKIKEINIDAVIDSYYIQTFLSERPKSIFKQCGISEKPDIITGKMLEGRVAVIVDGSPFVLTLPFILIEDLQNSEDYYDDNAKVSFLRILRAIGILVAAVMPGVYISFKLFHYKALPLKFLITILNSSASIPLTPVAELLFAFLLFEILYESSLRIPKGLGSSFNIVGALILGDAAIKSNLASSPTILIVAVSSIAVYLVPDQISALRIMRVLITLVAGIMGIVGVVLAFIFLAAYLSDFDSYGSPYLAPYAPLIENDLKDALLKSRLSEMKIRPKSIPNGNNTRLKTKRGDNK